MAVTAEVRPGSPDKVRRGFFRRGKEATQPQETEAMRIRQHISDLSPHGNPVFASHSLGAALTSEIPVVGDHFNLVGITPESPVQVSVGDDAIRLTGKGDYILRTDEFGNYKGTDIIRTMQDRYVPDEGEDVVLKTLEVIEKDLMENRKRFSDQMRGERKAFIDALGDKARYFNEHMTIITEAVAAAGKDSDRSRVIYGVIAGDTSPVRLFANFEVGHETVSFRELSRYLWGYETSCYYPPESGKLAIPDLTAPKITLEKGRLENVFHLPNSKTLFSQFLKDGAVQVIGFGTDLKTRTGPEPLTLLWENPGAKNPIFA